MQWKVKNWGPRGNSPCSPPLLVGLTLYTEAYIVYLLKILVLESTLYTILCTSGSILFISLGRSNMRSIGATSMRTCRQEEESQSVEALHNHFQWMTVRYMFQRLCVHFSRLLCFSCSAQETCFLQKCWKIFYKMFPTKMFPTHDYSMLH